MRNAIVLATALVVAVTASAEVVAGVLGHERTATARQFSDEELRTVVEEAKRNGVRVMAHAHGREGGSWPPSARAPTRSSTDPSSTPRGSG